MKNNRPKPHLTNNALPCPRCQATQGYMKQDGYYKDFFCPVCLYQCPAKHYRTRQKEATTSTQPHDRATIKNLYGRTTTEKAIILRARQEKNTITKDIFGKPDASNIIENPNEQQKLF